MKRSSEKELDHALQMVSSSIGNCEKMLPKFAEGTSQHTLLKNRIKALRICRSLILHEDGINNYSKEALIEALGPIVSIISKCEKAQQKLKTDTAPYTRIMNLIHAMNVSKALITEEISRHE